MYYTSSIYNEYIMSEITNDYLIIFNYTNFYKIMQQEYLEQIKRELFFANNKSLLKRNKIFIAKYRRFLKTSLFYTDNI